MNYTKTTELLAGEFETVAEIDAAEGAALPTEIEILRPVKITKSPTKPDFEVTAADLDEYAANYKAGVRKGVPIDIEHGLDPTFGQRAAGWIKDVYVKATEKGPRLMAVPEWNKLGGELVSDKQFKFISPQFVPRSLGAYEDPEGHGKFYNVLKAVTITNKPLFKSLNALSASEINESGLTYHLLENIIYATERSIMNLEQVRVKSPSVLDDAEKKFLAEHRNELSASELIGFGLDVKTAEVKPEVKAEVKASEVKAAETVTIDATELATMKASIAALEIKANEGVKASEALKAKEVSEFVETHVKRGAIKAGEAEATTKMILASEDADGMKTLITNLPDRIIAAGEQGESDKGSLGNAQTAIEAKTKEILASEDGKSLDYATALKMTLNSNPELAREYAADLQGRA
jgi:hypothetical protein